MNCGFDQNVIFHGTHCFKYFRQFDIELQNPNISIIHIPNTRTAIFVIQIFTELIKQPSGFKFAEHCQKMSQKSVRIHLCNI